MVADGEQIVESIQLISVSCIIFLRPGGFGARDYRTPAQIRNNRGGGGGGRAGSATGGYNNYQQPWDGSNNGAGGNMRGSDRQSNTTGGYERYQQQATGNSGNRQADHSWWDSTS